MQKLCQSGKDLIFLRIGKSNFKYFGIFSLRQRKKVPQVRKKIPQFHKGIAENLAFACFCPAVIIILYGSVLYSLFKI
jgi:hypothetical protein